jgi:hypothetical protein
MPNKKQNTDYKLHFNHTQGEVMDALLSDYLQNNSFETADDKLLVATLFSFLQQLKKRLVNCQITYQMNLPIAQALALHIYVTQCYSGGTDDYSGIYLLQQSNAIHQQYF